MSDLADKLGAVRSSGSGRAGQSLDQLRKRMGVQPEAFNNDPPNIVVRGPFQTEFWVRVRPKAYELESVTCRGDR